jgi:hypothetical protein
MQSEMSPVINNMDKFLKLKLEVVYRGLPIDQARQRFEELKQEGVPIIKPSRKLKK